MIINVASFLTNTFILKIMLTSEEAKYPYMIVTMKYDGKKEDYETKRRLREDVKEKK